MTTATKSQILEINNKTNKGEKNMKYTVKIGGFVTAFRERKLTVYAKDQAEAEKKAIDKFHKKKKKNGNSIYAVTKINSSISS